MNAFKCYHLFIPGKFLPFKLFVLYVLIPAICIGLSVLATQEPSGALVVSMTSMVAGVDMILDLWSFGGIQTKDARQFKYLRNPFCGGKFLHAALRGDFYRRFFTCYGASFAGYFLSNNRLIRPDRFFFFVTVEYLAVEIFVISSRFFDSMVANTLIMCLLIGVLTGSFTASAFSIGNEAEYGGVPIYVSVFVFILGLGCATLRFHYTRHEFERSFQ